LLDSDEGIEILPFNVFNRKTDTNVGNQFVKGLEVVNLSTVVRSLVTEFTCERGN
jgi:hypothetical protein